METKFKIGDTVKVVTSNIDKLRSLPLRRDGNIATILRITKTGKYKIDRSHAEYEECELILVKG